MKKLAALIYGLVAYLGFVGVLLYLIGFLGDFGVPKSINSGPETSFALAFAINIGLLVLFGLPHSIMARPGFKKWWTRTVPRPIERTTYVFISDVLMVLLLWQWRPMPGVIWHVESAAGSTLLWILFWTGWGILLAASWFIDHFDLFGLRQVYLYARGQSYEPPRFKESFLYKTVRHPLMVGWLLGFWSTPHMTVGHLVFSIGTSVYILIAIQIEERDLVTFHGHDYVEYRRRVPMLIPFLRKLRGGSTAGPSSEAER